MNWQDIVQGQQYKNSDDWNKEAMRNSFINQTIDSYQMNDQQAQEFRTEFDQHTAPRGNVYSGAFGDAWRSLGSGALSATADAASFFTGGKPNAVSTPIRNYAEDMAEERSPSTIRAVENLGFGEGQEITGRGLGYGVLSGLGSVAPMVAGGGLLGAGIKVAGKALPAYRAATGAMEAAETVGAATAAAPRLAQVTGRINKVASTGGYGAVGGLMVGGGAGHQTYEEILRQPDQVFIDSPAFQNYYRQTYQESPNDKRKAFEAAKEQLAAEYSKTARNIGGVIGAVSVAALGPQLHRIITGKGAQGALMGGLQGAGTEAAQEIFESGGQQLGTNYAMAPLDNRSLLYDVANVAGTNALIGAGAGGTIGSVTGQFNKNRPEMTDKNWSDAIKQNDVKLADLDTQLKQNTESLRLGVMLTNDPTANQEANAAKMKEYEADRIKILNEIRQTSTQNAEYRTELTKKQSKATGQAGPTPGAEGATAGTAEPQWQQWTPPGGRDFERKPGGYTDEGTYRTPRENPFNQIGQQRIFNKDGKPFARTIDAINYAEDNLLTRFPYYLQAVDGGYILVGLSDTEVQQQGNNIVHIEPGTDFDMVLEGQFISLSDVVNSNIRQQSTRPLEQQPPQEEQHKQKGRVGRAANQIFETAKDAYAFMQRNNIVGNVVQLDNKYFSIQPQTGSRSEESVLYGDRSGRTGTTTEGVRQQRQREREESSGYQLQQHPGYARESTQEPTALEDRRTTFVDTRGNVGTDLQEVTATGQQQQQQEISERPQRESAAAQKHPGYPYVGEPKDLELYAAKASQLNKASRKFQGDPQNIELYNEFKKLIREVKQLEKKAMEQAKAKNQPVEITNLVDMVKEARAAIDANKIEEFNRLSEEIRQQLYQNEQQLKGLTKSGDIGNDSRLGNSDYQDYLRMTADEVSGDILSDEAREKQGKSKRREIQPDDTVLDGIRKLGGILTGSLEDTISESLSAAKGKGYGSYVNKNGYTVDDMGRILSQYGYMDDNGQEYGANSLSQAINDELQGRPKFSSTEGNYDRTAGEQRPRAVDGGSKITKPAVDAALAGEPLNPIYRKEVNRILNEADGDPNFSKPEHLTQAAAEIEQGRKNQAITEYWYDRYEQIDYENADNRSALDSDDFTSPDWQTIEDEAKQSEMLADAALNEELNRTEEDEGESNTYPTAGQTLRAGARTGPEESTEGGTPTKKPAAGETGTVTPALETTTQTKEELQPTKRLSVADYYNTEGARELAHRMKEGDESAIDEMAQSMADIISNDAVLIPVPSRTGKADQALKLANKIKEIKGGMITVFDDATGNSRESVYNRKKDNKPINDEFLGFEKHNDAPKGTIYIIDGVYDTGVTSERLAKLYDADFILTHSTVTTKPDSVGKFVLETQTDKELQKRSEEQKGAEAETKKKAQAEKQKAAADKDRNDFLLTGSDSVSDKAAAEGQGDLLSGGPTTTPKETKPTEKPKAEAKTEKKATSGRQAKAGGEWGLNGEWYAGGQFMPASAFTIKGQYKVENTKGKGRTLIAPGEFAAIPINEKSIFAKVREFTTVKDGKLSVVSKPDAALIAYFDSDLHKAKEKLNALVELYNKGLRTHKEAELEKMSEGTETKPETKPETPKTDKKPEPKTETTTQKQPEKKAEAPKPKTLTQKRIEIIEGNGFKFEEHDGYWFWVKDDKPVTRGYDKDDKIFSLNENLSQLMPDLPTDSFKLHPEYSRLDEVYGKLSDADIQQKLRDMTNEIAQHAKVAKREFTGQGGRRSGAAVSADAVRDIGQEKRLLKLYMEERNQGNAKPKKKGPGQRYSIKKETGEKNLFVSHNITAQGVIEANKLGGLAAPSIAVARSDISSFDDYGEISLLAKPELLSDRKIRAFDADIYSPRQPRPHYDINAKSFYAFNKTLDPDNMGLSKPNINESEQTDGPEQFIRSGAVKYAYLQEIGKAPTLKNSKVEPEVRAASKIGVPSSFMDIDPNSKFYEQANKYYQRKLKEITEKAPERANRWEEMYFDKNGKLNSSQLRDFYYEVENFINSDGKDIYKLNSDIDLKISTPKNRKAYEQWATDKFNSMVKGRQIFKGYTDLGDRSYKKYTLENVVKDMTQKLQNGENYFYGSGSIRSAYAKEFKSIKDIQKSRNKIITKEEFDTIKEESTNVLMDALEKLKPYYKFESESFGYLNDAGTAIAEGRAGQAEAFVLNAEARKIIDDLTEYLTALPTTYFEAKAQRAVSFSEFDTAVVPKGTDKAVLDILRGAGLKIKTYDKKVEGDRQRVISAQNRLLFKQGAAEAAGIDSKTASKVAENMERELGVKVNIATDESQLPQHIQDTMEAEGTTGVRGVFDQRTGQAWIVSKNLENEADATKTVLHEIAGHQALSQMLGTTMDNIMGSIYKNMPATEKSRIENSKEYAGQLNDLEPAIKQAIVAEEYLADLAATNPTSSTLRRFISKVRRVLRKLFPSITWTENDVVELLQAAREKLKVTGATGTAGTENRYSLKAASVLDGMPEQLVKDMKKVNAGIRQQQGIVERVKSWLSDMELNTKDAWKAIADYAYTKTIDSFYPIARMEKSFNRGKLLEASESASKAAARTKNLNSQMTAVLGKGTPMLKDGSVVLRPGSKGMLEIFEPVAKDGQLETWEHWSAAMRSQRLINEDKAANIQGAKDAAAAQQAIDQLRKIPSTQYPGGLIGLNAAIKEQKVKKAIANKMIKQKRENLLNQEMIDRINQYVDARPALKKQFEAVHKDYQTFNKGVLDFAEEAGLIDPESRKLWEKDDYLPFHRINRLDEGKVTNLFGKRKGLSNQKSGIMQLTGGVEQINPIESIYRNTASLIDASMKNIAMLRIADIGTQTGLFELTKSIEKITDEQAIARLEEKGIIEEGEVLTPTQLSRWKNLLLKFEDYGEGTAKVSRDGKTEVYQVHDTELLKTVQALGPDSLHAILRIFAMPGRLLRSMVTATPSFMARNFVRDTLSTWMGIHPKINGQSISASIVKAVANVKNGLESDDHWALMMAGGGSGGYYEVSPDNFRGTLTPNQYKAHHRKVIDNTKKAWDWWQKQGSRFEDANRLAIFEEVIAKGGSIAEAAHQAQDVLNFTRTGSSQALRIMTATIPFLNARMQGLDRLARGGIENPSIVLIKGAIYTAASMALWAAFKDDERYKSLPEHEKLTWHHAWTPGGEHLRFPKPFEHGAIFATVPEIAGNMLLNGENGQWAGKMIGGILQDIFALDYPQFMGPALEVARNKNSFTGAPIIPLGQQYQLPQSQYSPWTSETAKVIAESMPNIAPEWTKSPKKVEHLLKGYFGSFGTWLVGSTYSPIEATTRAVRGAASRPSGDIRDIPVLGSFARGTEQGSTRYSTEMYDLLKSSNELATTIKRYQEEGRTAEAGSLEKANKKSLENRKMLNRYSKEISEIRKGTRKTLESKFISSPLKKQKSDQDNRKIQQIYRKAIREAS